MTTTRRRWLAAAAALIVSLLGTAAPAVAQTGATPAEEFVDQWAVGKDWSASPETIVDQWAVGKDWSASPETIVDQWAVGKDWSATGVEGAEPSTTARSLSSTQLQLIVAGFLIAAALGITTAAAISRHRHTFSAH